MVHHVGYFQLKPEAEKNHVEELVRTSRSLLLQIPKVLSAESGRNLDPSSQWQFFSSIEIGSLAKLKNHGR